MNGLCSVAEFFCLTPLMVFTERRVLIDVMNLLEIVASASSS